VKREWRRGAREVHEGQTRNLYEIAGNRKGVRRRRNRQGKGRNTSKVDTEIKWGKVKERKQTKGKRARKAIRIQEGRIFSRGSYRRTLLGNGTGWGRRIEIGASTSAVR
jgi:hypothetical protein